MRQIVLLSVALLRSRAHLFQSDPCHLVWQVSKIRRLEEKTQPVRPLPPGVAGEEDSHGEHNRNALSQSVCAESDSPSDRKSTRLNSSHLGISYAVFCL